MGSSPEWMRALSMRVGLFDVRLPQLAAALTVLVIASCGGVGTASSPAARTGAAKIAVPLGPAASHDVARVSATVTAADIDALHLDLEIADDGVATGTIDAIPVGIKDMSEMGFKQAMQAEFALARENGNAGEEISAEEVNPSPGRLRVPFTTARQFPLITLVSMVAPSPDWFVGVSGLGLLDEDGEWAQIRRVVLLGYDAGTDGGATYSAPNQPLQDRIPINLLSFPPFVVGGERPSLGTFTFELQ